MRAAAVARKTPDKGAVLPPGMKVVQMGRFYSRNLIHPLACNPQNGHGSNVFSSWNGVGATRIMCVICSMSLREDEVVRFRKTRQNNGFDEIYVQWRSVVRDLSLDFAKIGREMLSFGGISGSSRLRQITDDFNAPSA